MIENRRRKLIYKYIKAKENSEKYYYLDWHTLSIYPSDLEASVKADKELNEVKKEIREEFWFWWYLLFIFSKNRFYKKYAN